MLGHIDRDALARLGSAMRNPYGEYLVRLSEEPAELIAERFSPRPSEREIYCVGELVDRSRAC